MEKDFDQWNTVKKEIDAKTIRRDFFFYEREVWWCSVGVNVGVESDGKNENFERPVLILKKFNGQMVWTIPLTSKARTGEHYLKITHENGISWACLSQLKTTSTKRLIRKIGMISEQEFGLLLENIVAYLKKSNPATSAGSSEAEATNN
ncbi:MAG: type II toxin-antitoxin system PemK/MazF family toxin [Candidatus Sungbacteria bacterium]|nr:type II toxin-antitoxin system PemK/MazF family toxin [Candidatus Sungbacteria bacterium]